MTKLESRQYADALADFLLNGKERCRRDSLKLLGRVRGLLADLRPADFDFQKGLEAEMRAYGEHRAAVRGIMERRTVK